MVQKVYGPVRAAGVQITELDGEKTIEPGALGQVAYVGMFEKGDVGKLIQVPSKTSFLKKLGSYIGESQAPDAAIDFFDLGRGAGGLWAVRVTDGNELQSEMTLYARRATVLTPMGTLKAKNGGRWGGKERRYTNTVAGVGSFTATTLTTLVATFKKDQWKGGFIELAHVAGRRYPIVGNTAAGVITVAADATMSVDMAGASDFRYYLVLENEDKALSVEVRDGEEYPDTEFSLAISVDGAVIQTYPNLSTDPTSDRYWVSEINDDDGNDEVFAVDLWTGEHTATVRPANHYSANSAITATTLTAVIHDVVRTSPGSGTATTALGATTDVMVEQTITATFTSATAFTVASDKFGSLGSGTTGVAVASPNKWTPGFTITAGGSPMASGDTIVIHFKPFVVDQLIGGYVYPDKVNSPRTKFRIIDNDHKIITVASGSDMTTVGAMNDEFMVQFAEELQLGRDGHADIADDDYVAAYDPSLSKLRQLEGKNLGLVKLGTPGVTAIAVQKAGIAYAEAKNLQYRVEIPGDTVTEAGADDFVNSDIGRSDYAVVSFPSYGYVTDPEGNAGLKLTTLTGQIHGREASIAKDFDGYHKAAAGVDAKLSKVLKLPTGDEVLDEEFLNPLGINLVKKVKGNFVLWGDRSLQTDPTWRFKHHREQMSHYEHVLQESFDWIIFAINDPRTEKLALTAMKSFFLPEYQKRALRGDTFEDAALIKIDSENNTNATRAAGDMFCDLLLRLADTVEKFRIRIGKLGVFESTA